MSALRTHHPLAPVLFLAPAGVVLGVFFLAAAMEVAWSSFTDASAFTAPGSGGAAFVGLANYRSLLSTGTFYACLVNSAIYLAVTPAILALSLTAALCVAADLKWAKGLRLVLFLPVVTPTVVAALAWRVLYDENGGLLNEALERLGMEPVRWLSEKPWTLISAMLVTLWKGFGFYMMVLLTALLAVPRELKEAASIDGAGRLGVFWNVVVPSIRPAMLLVLVVSSISALKVFDEIFVTIQGTPITHKTIVPLVYELAFTQGKFGLASAAGMLLFVVILVLSVANLRLSRRAA